MSLRSSIVPSLQFTRSQVKWIAAAGTVVVLALVGIAPLPAIAQDRQEKSALLQQEFRESTRTASQALKAAQEVEAEAAAARRSATREQREYGRLNTQAQKSTDAANRARSSAKLARERVNDAQAELDEAEAALGLVARNLYMQGPTSSVMVVLNAESLTDLTRELELNQWAGDFQERRISGFDRARLRAAEAARSLEDRVEQAEALEAEANALAETAKRARDAATRAARDAARLAATAQARLADARRAARADEAKLRAFDAETRRLRAALQAGPPNLRGPSSSGLIRPVGGPITSPYGMRRHPVTGEYKLHTGTDIGAPCGTPIAAAANGTVLSAGYDRAYGYRTVIRHGRINGKDLTTTYNHQSRIGVRAGQSVQQGAMIGWVGSTGYSTGCHLHWEVLVNGSFVDPLSV